MDRALVLSLLGDPEVRSVLRDILAEHRPAKYMTIQEYADHHKVSKDVITDWIKYGLPGYVAGHVRRIPVDEADAWVEAGHANKPVKARRARRASS